MSHVQPISLPTIDRVEVVQLAGMTGNQIGECMSGRRNAKRANVSGSGAQEIADLFRSLPPGEQMRCHLPPFGLTFRSGDTVIWMVSICWKCNNIQGKAAAIDVAYEFDASASASKRLLKLCKQAMDRSNRE